MRRTMPLLVALCLALSCSLHVLHGGSLPDKEFPLSKLDPNRPDFNNCALCRGVLNANTLKSGSRIRSDAQQRAINIACSQCASKRIVPEQIKIQAACRQCWVVVAQTKQLLSPCVAPEEVEMIILRMCAIVSTRKPIEMCVSGVVHGFKQMEFWRWKTTLVPYSVCRVYGSCGLLYKPYSPEVKKYETKEPCLKRWETMEPCMKKKEWPRAPSLSPRYPFPLPTMSPSIKERPLPKLSEIPGKPCRFKRPLGSPKVSKKPLKSIPYGLPKISEIPHQIKMSPIRASRSPSSPCAEQDFMVSKDRETSDLELDNDEDHLWEVLTSTNKSKAASLLI